MLRHTLSVLYEECRISARVQVQAQHKDKAKAMARCEARCVGTWHVFLLSFWVYGAECSASIRLSFRHVAHVMKIK